MSLKILNPVEINHQTLTNPLVFGPHRCNFPEGHLPGPRRIAYYLERAKNGVGMIVVEGSQVLPGEYPYDWALNVYEANSVKAYRGLAGEIHKYPTILVGQLNHYGGQGDSSVTRKPLLAPSPVAEVNSNEIPKVMTLADIDLLKKGFAHGCEVLVEAGFDGVEINAGQFSLLRQFLSGLTNFRADEFGGSLKNRCRLLLAVLQKARKIIGEEKILGLRLCGDEYAPWAGLQPEVAKEIAEYLSNQVKIDYLAVENGSIYSINLTMAGYDQPETYALAAAKTVGENLPMPICAGGSLVSPEVMATALADFALLDVTRALIADPKLIPKIRQGKTEEIVPCILCKQGCHTHANTNPVVACSLNPLAGEEAKHLAEAFQRKPQKAAKNVLVAGGGIAGMVAAMKLAEIGHSVILYEETGKLGGHWGKFAANFHSEKPQVYLDYLTKSLKRLGVVVQLNTSLTLAEIKTKAAAKLCDGLIVAAGANYEKPVVAGDAMKISLDELLAANFPELGCGQLENPENPENPEKITAKSRALVIDDLGDYKAIVACRKLCDKGYEVVLVTADSYLATALVKLGEFGNWYGEVAARGIITQTNSQVKVASFEKLVLENKYNQGETQLPGVDLVVAIQPPIVENKLWQEVQNLGIACLCIGDAVAPRGLMAAVREGYEGANLI